MRPKKSFSQNFLVNDTICKQIVWNFQEQLQGKNVLEVGPGKGALTKYLAQDHGSSFKVVEADADMVQYLLENQILSPEQIVHKDFLKLNLSKIFDQEEFSIIGNFPYNISTQILFKVYDYKEFVPMVVGMFQREVAERIVSDKGSKIYGVTSVLLQSIYEAKLLFHVKPGSFFPPPKVTSSVLLLKRKEDYTIPCNPSLFRTVVKASFNQRRKMIRNSLKAHIRNPELLESEFMDKRPEQLSIEDYYTLTNSIENQ